MRSRPQWETTPLTKVSTPEPPPSARRRAAQYCRLLLSEERQLSFIDRLHQRLIGARVRLLEIQAKLQALRDTLAGGRRS
jgi:hypothetical protein